MAEEPPLEPTWSEIANEKVDAARAALEDLVSHLGLVRTGREIRRARAGELDYVVTELRAISSLSKSLAERYGGDG
jgi:hypothetical protein